jgi:putative phosphoribosyl transferase
MGKLRIVSHDDRPFEDRVEAGRLLGQELSDLRGQRAVVLGIPRGGLVIARELARLIEADLDIVLSHKLGAPGNSELAIGAVAEDGRLFLHRDLVGQLGVDSSYIEREKELQLAVLAQRTRQARRVLPRAELSGRLVIVTDDGVATGATLQAALWAARQENPKKLIAALPVGPQETIARLAEDVDEMVCLRAPYSFSAVGQFYLRFDQVEDDEVARILAEEAVRRAGGNER